MINSVKKPDISMDFTINDIHKIREYHYELIKNMSIREKIEFYNSASQKFEKLKKSVHQLV